MSKLEDVLGRVEHGEYDANDADWLREQFALQAIGRVAAGGREPAASSAAIQERVLQTLESRGHREGWNDSQYAARQIIWGMTVMTVLVRNLILPILPKSFGKQKLFGALNELGVLSDSVLCWEPPQWQGCGIDIDVPVSSYERLLTGVQIALMAAATLLNIDMIAAVDGWCKRTLVTETGGNGNGHG